MILGTCLLQSGIENFQNFENYEERDLLEVCYQTIKKFYNFSNPWGWTLFLMSLIPVILAGILSWQCNEKENIFIRILNLLIAIIFNEIYIIYYIIYRVILKNKCY